MLYHGTVLHDFIHTNILSAFCWDYTCYNFEINMSGFDLQKSQERDRRKQEAQERKEMDAEKKLVSVIEVMMIVQQFLFSLS